jgi:transcription initiation factor TFIID subunit TAF12
MGIQTKAAREKFSRLRQSLLLLMEEMKGLIEPFFSDRPVLKGTVYELKRKCGKPGCKCAQGALHARMVLSASESGKTRLRAVPRGFLVDTQQRVKRYQQLRRARARVVQSHRQMLKLMDAMEAMRRQDGSGGGKDSDGSGDL